MARNWAAAPSQSTWPSRGKSAPAAAGGGGAVVVDTAAAAVAIATDPVWISGRGPVRTGSRLFIFRFRIDSMGGTMDPRQPRAEGFNSSGDPCKTLIHRSGASADRRIPQKN